MVNIALQISVILKHYGIFLSGQFTFLWFMPVVVVSFKMVVFYNCIQLWHSVWTKTDLYKQNIIYLNGFDALGAVFFIVLCTLEIPQDLDNFLNKKK